MATHNDTPKLVFGANGEALPPQHQKVALITGITGQDRSYLTEFLLDKGYEVHGLINHICIDPHNTCMKLHYADLTDASSLSRCIDMISPDEVYSLAAQSDMAVSFPTDVVATVALQLLKAVCSRVSTTSHGHIRYCQAGSTEMFGRQSERCGSWKRMPLSETSPFHPRSPYAASLCAAYWYTIHYRKAYVLFACNGILSNHESPRQGENFMTWKIKMVVGRIKIGLQSELFLVDLENVEGYRDWGFAGVYVDAM